MKKVKYLAAIFILGIAFCVVGTIGQNYFGDRPQVEEIHKLEPADEWGFDACEKKTKQ